MNPAHIEGAQSAARKPENWNEEVMGRCGTLPLRMVARDGLSFMESAWEPTPDELAALAKGAKVILAISAPQHPVVALYVGPVPPEILGISRIAVGDPEARNVRVWDEIADREVECCVEVNCAEGWADILLRDDKGNFVHDGDEIKRARIEGTFTIRRA